MPAPFDQGAFEAWCLADFGKAPATVRYHISRLRAMQRLGLDADAYLADPRAAHRQAQDLLALVKKRDRPSIHVERNYRRVLNWLSAYAEALQPGTPWSRWPLPKEPPAVPKTIDADLQLLRTYVHRDPYVTLMRRAIADVALAGNFRRDEIGQLRVGHLHPESGQIMLPRAAKGGISGLVEVPWTLYWPDAPLIRYLEVRVPVPGTDALWTMTGAGRGTRPYALGPAGVYQHLRSMGRELGIPLTFVRTRRRSLSDIDDRNVNMRVVQAKGRHNDIKSTVRYLRTMTSTRARAELEGRHVPGFDPDSAARAVQVLPAGPGGTNLRRALLPGRPGAGPLQPDGLAQAVGDAVQRRADAPDADDEQHEQRHEEQPDARADLQERVQGRHALDRHPPPHEASEAPGGAAMVRGDPMATYPRPGFSVDAAQSSLTDEAHADTLTGVHSSSTANQETATSMPATQLVVKKGSVRAVAKPVTDLTFGLVAGESVTAELPGRAALAGGAREPSDGHAAGAATRQPGTFTRTSRVALLGARASRVPSRYPATRSVDHQDGGR